MMKIRWLIGIAIICGAMGMAAYRLAQAEPEIVTAAPAKALPSVQATTIEEVVARGEQPAVDPTVVFEEQASGYHLTYPYDWDRATVSANVVSFHSPDRTTQVKVEAVGPLPADGLTAFVERTLGNDQALSRQSLTVHGQPAERVITQSPETGDPVTTFFIEAEASAYLIRGVGEQRAIEMIARSFNAPRLVAQR